MVRLFTSFFTSCAQTCSQDYSKTGEGWPALAQVIRYHQPPSSRFRRFTSMSRFPLCPTRRFELADNMAVLRTVFLTLTSYGAYRNIYKGEREGSWDVAIALCELLKRSHITDLSINDSDDLPAVSALMDFNWSDPARCCLVSPLCPMLRLMLADV